MSRTDNLKMVDLFYVINFFFWVFRPYTCIRAMGFLIVHVCMAVEYASTYVNTTKQFFLMARCT